MGLLSLSITSYSQDVESKKEEDMSLLSLEQLMNIPINSASKKDETLFDAPLSSYTITRSDIDNAGSTSIMEALRLAPGVIVREQANGMYDIHIRGMENVTRTNSTAQKTNMYTLVMIDNRPVFNHGLGGTNWESLPIDINDVERIEIVRGPSSPLFGPNAVTGVINIITKRMNGSALWVNSTVQTGTLNTTIASASVGKKFGEKFSGIVSLNFQDRNRVDSKYYQTTTGEYLDLDQYITDPVARAARYPDPSRSLSKWGVNGYLTYKASDNVSVDLSLSTQASSFQKVWILNPLNDGKTDNRNVNLSAKIYGLSVRTSYFSGHNIDLRNAPYSEFDSYVADVVAEYDIKLSKKYSITPGVSYQSVTFDDLDYVDPVSPGVIGLFNAKNTITTLAGYLRSDLNFTEKLRVIAAVRVDKFSDPDKAYLAYEFASTYKLNSKNLIRAAVTRSNSGSFIGFNFLDIGGLRNGNTNLSLFTLNMIEIGYRSQITSKLQFDMDVFQQQARNLIGTLQMTTPGPFPQQFQNVPIKPKQLGVTFSLNYVPNDKIQIKPFVTIQKTETKNLPSSYVDPNLSPGAVTYSDSKDAYTPASYGGFYFNYKPVSKFNINLSGYYFSKQTQYDQSYNVSDTSTPQYAYGQIKGKFMMNVKVSYEVVKNLKVFINARNAFNSPSREFYAADQTAALYTGGLSYNLLK
jgi:iron complex outermembrane receptor protein